MSPEDTEWMTYLTDELDAFCRATGWKHQLRRRWEVRERSVADSPLEDYEWKLSRERDPGDGFEGEYFLVGARRQKGTFWVQHDTIQAGVVGAHWERETVTELRPNPIRFDAPPPSAPPRAGWLRDHLEFLTTRFKPNQFSRT